jgi:hypothetical protein
MEDIVYIILAIVWLVISVLGGKKKKQAQQQQTRPARPAYEEKTAPPPGSEIEDMLEEFFGKPSKPTESEPVAEQEPEPVFKNEEHTFEYEPDHQESLETIEETDFKKYEYQEPVASDYQFAGATYAGSLDDIIRQYQESDEKALEEAAKLSVVDLDMNKAVTTTFDFDPRLAVIYSAILNRQHS